MFPGKRKYYRLSIEVPCAFKIIKGKNPEEVSPPLKGVVKDVSLEGLQFVTDTLHHANLFIFNEFEKGQDPDFKPNFLLIKFFFPGEEEPFILYGMPRWWSEADLSESFDYQIGVRYMRARKEDLLRLKNSIDRHGDKEKLSIYAQKKQEDDEKKALADKIAQVPASKYGVAVLPMRYKIISGKDGKESRYRGGMTRNLSLSGLCAGVETMTIDNFHMAFDQDPLKRNTILLEITIPGQTQPVTTLGEARWFELSNSQDRYKYDVGIKFLKISERDKYKIAQYISHKPEARTGVKPA